MSEYYMDAGHSFIVSESNKDKAIEWFVENEVCGDWLDSPEPQNISVIEIGDGRYIVDTDKSPFTDEWRGCRGVDADANELLSLCEDGSYVSLYHDAYYEYIIFWRENGIVNEEYKEVENPFKPMMDRLDEQALGIFKR